jgi:hypothetical protein
MIFEATEVTAAYRANAKRLETRKAGVPSVYKIENCIFFCLKSDKSRAKV